MKQIATPISHQFENDNNAKEIIIVSDCLEVRESSLDSNWPNQHLFHSDFDIINEWDSKTFDYLNNVFISKLDLKLVSFQATACCSEPRLKDHMFQLGGKIYSRNEMIKYAKGNITWLRTVLNNDVGIAIENNNYYPTEAYDIVTNGDFISEIVYESDIYLLFDMAHAMVTAHNKKISYKGYINTLPLEKMIQIHICKPEISANGIAYDAHERPDDDMYERVTSLIQKYDTIKYLTVEYYKDKDILIDSLRRLRKFLDGKIL